MLRRRCWMHFGQRWCIIIDDDDMIPSMGFLLDGGLFFPLRLLWPSHRILSISTNYFLVSIVCPVFVSVFAPLSSEFVTTLSLSFNINGDVFVRRWENDYVRRTLFLFFAIPFFVSSDDGGLTLMGMWFISVENVSLSAVPFSYPSSVGGFNGTPTG